MSAPAPLRKGWCPGAWRPMAAKDGLLVRLRLTGGIVRAEQARVIADLAARFGNGLIDLTSRANLQLRGVTPASWPALIEALRDLALVDDDDAAEAVRNVMASPLAGLHDGLDIRPLVRDLEAKLVTDPGLRRLPGKFGFLIDDGGHPSLASVSADVRFDWLPATEMFSIGLGGTRGSALRIGRCARPALIVHAHRAALGAIALFWEGEAPRRLRGLIDALGDDAVATACGGTVQDALATPDGPASDTAGLYQIQDRSILALAAPFGRLNAAMLRCAAQQSAGELRLTPWRSLLLPDAPDADLAALRGCGFIADAQDPRLRIIACVGRDGCACGTTPTHADATLFAAISDATASPIHVSGCAKGCAHAAAAPLTLVGRDGLYDLVRNGRAGDPPSLRDLDLAAVRAVLAA